MSNSSFEQFAECAGSSDGVPPSASKICVQSISGIDGHISFIRYLAPRADALTACGELCSDSNRSKELPVLWPAPDEVDMPSWFQMTPTTHTWLSISATPYVSTDVDGNPVPCGFRRASGKMVRLVDDLVYRLDFSIQWYRTGCGG